MMLVSRVGGNHGEEERASATGSVGRACCRGHPLAFPLQQGERNTASHPYAQVCLLGVAADLKLVVASRIEIGFS